MQRFLMAAAIWVASMPAASAQSGPEGVLARDLSDFAALLVGRFDNDRQVFFAGDTGIPDAERAERIHLEIVESESEDSPRVFRVVRSGGAAGSVPESEMRWTISANEAENLISVLIEQDDARCAVDWRRMAGGFSGSPSEPCDDRLRPYADAMLSPGELWLDGGELQLRRAREFTCWVAVLRGAEHGESGIGINDWFFTRDVHLHDQGGRARVTTDETPPRDIELRLRNVEWPYGNNRPSLTLYVHEDGNDRATSYAWGEYDADRLGINLRWIQASCTIDGAD